MANPQKNKGDRFERLAVAWWIEHEPRLLVERPERELGAGRKEDKGDLKVLPDCAIQVKALNDTVAALRQSASKAAVQRHHREVPFGVGMVPIMRARNTSVKWLMSTYEWPCPVADDGYLITGVPSTAVERVRDDRCGIPRVARFALVRIKGQPDMWVSTFEAWVAAYRTGAQPALF